MSKPLETVDEILAEMESPDALNLGVYPHEWAARLRAAHARARALLPTAVAAQEVALAQWPEAYSAFVGAFDTPLARRQLDNEYAQDARRRLRTFNENLYADEA